eukprot:CAMPEP_0182446760 /NCGR_PEP_ID=MMETSP1172-20130603/5963_1 /TAXON_ID=708627 /ORGANISM="Timspurckia oligopyrenoides, Strain CCMP3278" /LENGTH=183 /DNA_ID=CAMNT_0024642823 /DNA_START=36 /DNA_END=584 /DNA_ORIENTATION=+
MIDCVGFVNGNVIGGSSSGCIVIGNGSFVTAHQQISTVVSHTKRSICVMQDNNKGGGLFGGFPGLGGGGDAEKKAAGGGGMFGGMGNIMEAMKKAKEFTEATKVMQDDLKTREVSAESADGNVTVVVSGSQVPLRVTISDDLVKQGSEATAASVTEAMVEAHAKSLKQMQDEFAELSKKYGLP